MKATLVKGNWATRAGKVVPHAEMEARAVGAGGGRKGDGDEAAVVHQTDRVMPPSTRRFWPVM